jgi:hypothetical protein
LLRRRYLQQIRVANAKAHRFRHTLATEILAKGYTVEDAANILGDDPATIRRYYLKWSPAYQARTVEIMAAIHGGLGTPRAQTKNSETTDVVSIPYGMLEVGVEPTCPVKGAGF